MPESTRFILILIYTYGWISIQFDISNAYKTATPDCVQYARYPKGLPDYEKYKKFVVQILLNWEGTKQGTKVWYDSFVPVLRSAGYTPTISDKAFWQKRNPANNLCTYVSIYVDDGIGATQDPEEITFLINHLRGIYDITTKKMIDKVLGINIRPSKNDDHIMLCESYCLELAEELGIDHTTLPKPTTPGHPKLRYLPNTTGIANQSMITKYQTGCGSLNWLTRQCRPEISYIVSELSQFLANPSFEHYDALVRVITFCIGTPRWGIKINKLRPNVPKQLTFN